MTESNVRFPIGLNIHLVSFDLPKRVIRDNEEIRVSITTMPEERKQHFHMHAKKMHKSNHVFSINITNQTKKVIMVFRRKSFLYNDPIIASTIIHASDFPKLPPGMTSFTCGVINTDVKTLQIFYPLQKQMQEMREERAHNGQVNPNEIDQANHKINRKVLGQMQIQMSFTTPYPDLDNDSQKMNSIKIGGSSHKFHSNDKKVEHDMFKDENNGGNAYTRI